MEGSITVPPYAPPPKMQSHLIPPNTPRSIFVYFRGLFYDVGNHPEGGYYARGAQAAVWKNFKDNPLFDISTEHPTTYYEDMQREGCFQFGQHADLYFPRDNIEKAEIACQPFNEAGNVIPTTCSAQPGDGLGRKLPHDRSLFFKPGEKIFNWTAGPVGDLKPW